jgi:hypothetical protein
MFRKVLLALSIFALPALADDTLPFKTNPGDIPPDRRIPPFAPAAPPLPQPHNAPIFTPPPPQPPAVAPIPGPVTGYGTGGMQAIPGAPPNPPFH